MNILAVLFSFSGRIGRGQYWLGYFIQLALTALLWMCLLTGQAQQNMVLLLAAVALGPVEIWIALATMAKRYHDRNKSAWWILVALIPLAGPIWQLVELGLLRGTEGSNDYGPDPAHTFNVADDIESMRRQAGHKGPVAVGAGAQSATANAASPRARSPYLDGRPVFGKRV